MIKMTVPRLTEGRGATLQTDTEPYLMKQTPQGDRELLSLVGGTVAFNQLISDTAYTRSESISSNAIRQNISCISGHIYLAQLRGTVVAVTGNKGIR